MLHFHDVTIMLYFNFTIVVACTVQQCLIAAATCFIFKYTSWDIYSLEVVYSCQRISAAKLQTKSLNILSLCPLFPQFFLPDFSTGFSTVY